jgi:hypothetical protein
MSATAGATGRREQRLVPPARKGVRWMSEVVYVSEYWRVRYGREELVRAHIRRWPKTR